MSENAARTAAGVCAGAGVCAIVISLWLGLAGNSAGALLFVAITLACLLATALLARRYERLRHGRWQSELGTSEQELRRLFDEARDGGEAAPTQTVRGDGAREQ